MKFSANEPQCTTELRLQRTLQEIQTSLNDNAGYDSISLSEDSPLFPLSTVGDRTSENHSRATSGGERVTGRCLRDKLLIATLIACVVTTVSLFIHVHSGHHSEQVTIDLPLMGISRHRAQRFADLGESFLSNEDVFENVKHLRRQKGLHLLRAPDGCEATILLLRHCEKAKIREHCAYVGYERAVYLSTLFGDGDERWPTPSYIFALAPGGRHNPKKHNFREVETVQPLADKANLTVDDSFDSKHTSRFVRHLLGMLRSGEMCGKVTVVNWKHTEIPHLAHKLGCGPDQGCPVDYPGMSFDEAWQIKFVYKKLWHSQRRNGKIPKHDRWAIYGSTQSEGFDPLAFSKLYNDYKPGGTNHGARWSFEDPDLVRDGSIKVDPED